MDPYRGDYRRPSMARSPTLRPDPRHHRASDTSPDTAIKFVRDFQRPDNNILPDAKSPIMCTRKAVLPAIGVSVSVTDTSEITKERKGARDSNNFSGLCSNPPTIIVEPNDSRPNHLAVCYNETGDAANPSETDEACLSTSTADSGFAEKDLENFIDSGEADMSQDHNQHQHFTSNKTSGKGYTTYEDSYNDNYGQHARLSFNNVPGDLDPDFDDSEFFPELQRPRMRKKSKSRLGLEAGDTDGRTRSRLASRNSMMAPPEEDEPRFGDESMLKPVSHQSVVAEDKLVSSRCRRSSKLLDKLMLSEYNTGHTTTAPFFSQSSSSNSNILKGYQTKSFKSLSSTITMAGQILRPRNLPQLPPILKRQRTIDIPEEDGHFPTVQKSLGWERPSAPQPSRTPPSPSTDSERSGCDGERSEEESTIDFLDCR
ncbi:hypothetical protein EGW08_013697 [Elysia chlorotica]|uniref:Uncharacterized protein n=1 Tax=Elysia chlorotica TaxID=188477 RepID=A0A3S1BYY5_ELYCH|nr:hypothetical protein EGW08_013697 [Elysia chlorotica]